MTQTLAARRMGGCVDRITKYRDYARQCREIALRMTTEVGREELLNMAATWDELARRYAEAQQRMDPPRDNEG